MRFGVVVLHPDLLCMLERRPRALLPPKTGAHLYGLRYGRSDRCDRESLLHGRKLGNGGKSVARSPGLMRDGQREHELACDGSLALDGLLVFEGIRGERAHDEDRDSRLEVVADARSGGNSPQSVRDRRASRTGTLETRRESAADAQSEGEDVTPCGECTLFVECPIVRADCIRHVRRSDRILSIGSADTSVNTHESSSIAGPGTTARPEKLSAISLNDVVSERVKITWPDSVVDSASELDPLR